MKQNLQRVSEWIELFLNYCSGFLHRNCTECSDRGSCAGGGVADCSPVPCLLLSVPQKAEAFLGILSIASGSRCVWDPDGKALAGGGSCDCGAWCILWSAFHPPSSASGDTGTGVPAACSGSGGDRSIFGLQL